MKQCRCKNGIHEENRTQKMDTAITLGEDKPIEQEHCEDKPRE